jgi:Tol biopolymer transport system component
MEHSAGLTSCYRPTQERLHFALGQPASYDNSRGFDRSGNQIATVGDRLGNPDGVSYSPDHSELVFFERGATSSQLWMLDIRRGLVSRFTDDADENIFPLWARDGNRIIYTAVRNGQVSLYQRSIGTGQRELLVQSQTEETLLLTPRRTDVTLSISA